MVNVVIVSPSTFSADLLKKFLLLNAGLEHYYTLSEFPQTVEKKVKLLNYFRNYMKEHLLKAGANIEVIFFPYFSIPDK
jgi:hypothetical protein